MPSIKDVKRTTGDWHVQSEQDIHLETQYASGNNGTVYVWGNLNVQGNTTTISSNDLSIGDKVLVLNKGEPGVIPGVLSGVSGDGISGISISRGGTIVSTDPSTGLPIYTDNFNANLVFNQSKEWTYGGETTDGLWDFIIGPPSGGIGTPSGIVIGAIRTGSASRDLSILGAENPNATVTLSGVLNYTQRIVTRNNPDDVPNKGYVDFAIEAQPERRKIQLNFRNSAQDFIQRPETVLEFVDTDVPGFIGLVTEPQLRTSIGGNQWITVYNNRMVVGDIKILDSNRITMEATNTNLVLSTAPGTGALQNPSVEIDTSLKLNIDRTYQEPTVSSDSVKVYAGDPEQGTSGLYFVNSTGYRDELPSKRRSFFASLMF